MKDLYVGEKRWRFLFCSLQERLFSFPLKDYFSQCSLSHRLLKQFHVRINLTKDGLVGINVEENVIRSLANPRSNVLVLSLLYLGASLFGGGGDISLYIFFLGSSCDKDFKLGKELEAYSFLSKCALNLLHSTLSSIPLHCCSLCRNLIRVVKRIDSNFF